MSVYLTYLFYGAIFLSVLLLVEGLFYLLTGPGSGASRGASRGEETLSLRHRCGRAREQGGSCPSGTALAL